jgi:cyclophilin family peptidyl-prolyl cis-trans isomerase
MHAAYPSLDGQYTVFGKVTAGMDVVDKIANVPTIEAGRLDRPEKPVIIRSIEVYR